MINQEVPMILNEIENYLWEYEFAYPEQKHQFNTWGFRAAIKICGAAVLDKMWELQEEEKIDQSTREAMAYEFGNKFRELIKTYTGEDTTNLYSDLKKEEQKK